MATYRDSSGRTLDDYPRPSVAVDTAVLTLPPDGPLSVVVVRGPRERRDRLPGTFLHEHERLADAVLRSLREKAGVEGLAPRQLHVFDDPKRDPRGWVLSVAHVVTVEHPRLRLSARASVVPVDDLPPLLYRHEEIVALAVEELRRRYRASPDPDGLGGDEFTLRELREIHEAVLGEKLQRDRFARRMVDQMAEASGLTPTGPGRPGRPAQLYRVPRRTQAL